MTMLESNFNKILLNINPGVIPFLTATTIIEGKKEKDTEAVYGTSEP